MSTPTSVDQPVESCEGTEEILICYQPERSHDISQLAFSLIRSDAVDFFGQHLDDIFDFWMKILETSTLPSGIACNDPQVKYAFNALDGLIMTATDTLAPRLANVQLDRMMGDLKSIITSSRQQGIIRSTVGRGNATIALDLYVSAQDTEGGEKMKQRLQRRVRFARRWATLAASSPLLLVIFTREAERLV